MSRRGVGRGHAIPSGATIDFKIDRLFVGRWKRCSKGVAYAKTKKAARKGGGQGRETSALFSMGILDLSWLSKGSSRAVAPTIPAPRRTDVRHAVKWILTQVACQDSSLDPHYADNSPARPVTFDEQVHHKYHADIYFREVPRDGAQRGLRAKWACEPPGRNAQAQRAYDDFLRGLEVAGAQEHIHGDGSHTGQGIPEAEREGLLRELLGARYGGNSPDTRKELHLAAEWERFLQLRRDAPLRRRWVCRLQRRTQRPMSDAPEPGEYPPIRNNTYKMLVPWRAPACTRPRLRM